MEASLKNEIVSGAVSGAIEAIEWLQAEGDGAVSHKQSWLRALQSAPGS
jgi:hypothetical protein